MPLIFFVKGNGLVPRGDAKFYANVNCKMVLSFDSYSEIRNEDENKIKVLETDIMDLKEGMTKIFLLIQQNPILAHVKPKALSRK